MSEPTPPISLLNQVVAIDEQLWHRGGTTIAVRNAAVRTALGAGWTAAQIAGRLGVRAEDVLRWAG